MTSFQCNNCKYRFELKGERTPRNCPYCGKIGTVVRERSAEELLKDVSNMQRLEERD